MVIWGVDPSYRSYAIIALGSTPSANKVVVSDKIKDPHEIAKRLFDGGLSVVSKTLPSTVFIEEPVVAGARNLQSTLKIARSVGVLMGMCSSLGIQTRLVPVPTWKSEVTGNGNNGKPAVSAWLDQNEPTLAEVCGADQDLRDAACIALYGQGLQRRVDALRSGFQHGALDAGVAPTG